MYFYNETLYKYFKEDFKIKQIEDLDMYKFVRCENISNLKPHPLYNPRMYPLKRKNESELLKDIENKNIYVYKLKIKPELFNIEYALILNNCFGVYKSMKTLDDIFPNIPKEASLRKRFRKSVIQSIYKYDTLPKEFTYYGSIHKKYKDIKSYRRLVSYLKINELLKYEYSKQYYNTFIMDDNGNVLDLFLTFITYTPIPNNKLKAEYWNLELLSKYKGEIK